MTHVNSVSCTFITLLPFKKRRVTADLHSSAARSARQSVSCFARADEKEFGIKGFSRLLTAAPWESPPFFFSVFLASALHLNLTVPVHAD